MNTIKKFLDHIETVPSIDPAVYDKQQDGTWSSMSRQEYFQKIRATAAYLKAQGIKKGDKVAIFAEANSTWLLVDLAIMLIGAIAVPIYTAISSENFCSIVNLSQAKVLFIGGKEQHNFCKNYYVLFDRIIALDACAVHPKIERFKDVIEKGTGVLALDPELLAGEIAPVDIATIVFSSGTTGTPKGVELSHEGLLAQVSVFKKYVNSQGIQDRYLSFLPLGHIFGLIFNINYLITGGAIYYSRDINQLVRDCQFVKPTIMLAVPRLLEKAYISVIKKITEPSFILRTLGLWAFNLAHGQEKNFWKKLLSPIADIILYSKIRKIFGGKIRVIPTGGVKSDPELLWFFNNVGVTVIEGYGLTEACPISGNYPEDNAIGTVGKPFPGVGVKISPEGEILVKGNVMMIGYYQDQEATKRVIDAEGWLHTNDYGKLNADGRLIFEGRMDDATKTSYGIYIDVIKIETLLDRLSFVNFAVVIANEKPFVTCLIFPNFEVIDSLKKQLNLENLPDEQLLNIAFMKKTIDQAVAEVNVQLDRHEHIVAYRFIWDRMDKNFITQTMKVKRKHVQDKYKLLISEMYPTKTLKL